LMLRACGAVLLALGAAGCNSAQIGRSRVDSTLAAFIPPDATVLAGVRMDQVRATPIFQKMTVQKQFPRLDEFARATGFDPRKDVRDLLIGSNGRDTVVAARGTFNLKSGEGATKTTYKGYTLYQRDQGGVALIDSTTAVAGNLTAVHAAIDRFKAGDRTGPRSLLARAGEIAAENQVWSVSNAFDNLMIGRFPQDGNAAGVGRMLGSLENTTAAADLRSGVRGYLNGLCRTDQDAKNLGDSARGLVGLGRLSVPDNQPELLKLWDGIKVDQQQRTVKITVAIPQDLVDKLVEMFAKRLRIAKDDQSPAGDSPGDAAAVCGFFGGGIPSPRIELPPSLI